VDAADELFQEFALRFVRGDFRRADPSRGRFRDYVKRALINLVNNYRSRQQRRGKELGLEDPEAVAAAPETSELEAGFLESWRKALLERTWEALAAAEQPGGAPFHAVLRFSYEAPKVPSAQIAEELTTRLNPAKPFTAAGIRKTLQRARDLFAELLVEEVGRSIQASSEDELEQELGELGFLAYCKKALERRRATL
jgi:RNA polymerase sigma-70 factor (ECF subfamily)